MKPLAISAIVVSWKADPEELRALAAAYQGEAVRELFLVDNSGDAEVPAPFLTIRPPGNLGFAGGANFGAERATGDVLLVSNPDALPRPGAMAQLSEGFRALPQAAGLAPRLLGLDGQPQFRWQLRPLPQTWQLLAQALFLNFIAGPSIEPPPGARVAQPAGAVLALRAEVFRKVGGFDPAFWPAWFEDVDLAHRLQDLGRSIHYWPAAVFEHRQGGSLDALGYGRFLVAYATNLVRYLERHHSWTAAAAFRTLAPLGALLRLVLLAVRAPRREPNRRAARQALERYLLAGLRGFRKPVKLDG